MQCKQYWSSFWHFLRTHCAFRCHVRLVLLAVSLFVIALAGITANETPRPKLVFLGNKNIAPVVYLEDGTPAGIAVDVVRALARHISEPIEIRAMDWAEAQQLVAGGEADALIQINSTPEREKIYDFSDPLLESQFSIFTRTERIGITGLSSLRGLRVGVEAGGLPRQVLEKNPQIALTIIPDFIDGFKKIKDGAIDAIVVDYIVGSYIIAKNNIRDIRISGEPIAFSYSSIAVKKGNEKLLNAVNSALKVIRENGTYDDIIRRWTPKEVVYYTREQITRLLYYSVSLLLFLSLLVAAIWTVTLKKELNARKTAEEALRILNRKLRAITDCDEALIHAEDEQALLADVCRIVCDEAGYRMAWVGYREDDEARTIRCVASAGVEEGYVGAARITWAGTERGRGPSGTAVRTGKAACIQDFATDPEAAPWREAAMKRGYRSSIALPLKYASAATFGILCIYSPEVNTFTPDEIRLLEELSENLAFGITVLRDRTERRRAEDELRRYKDQLEETVERRTADLRLARDAAEAANRAKSAFLANMSHELRTPLNAILGFSAVLRREPELSEDQREKLDIINSSGGHLLALINDVLEVAKIEAVHTQVDIAPFDIGSMVSEVAEMMRVRAMEKGLRLQLDQSAQFPRYVRGDEARLRQVLVNLVSNAVKFTAQGSVTIRLGVRGNAENHLVMEVEDTGPGIGPEEQKRLFQPFAQPPDGREPKGTGLGLAISRQFVELMGGTIGVDSTRGKGSLFRIVLPVELASEAEIAALQGLAPVREVAGLAPGQPARRILIAEDQREDRLLLRKLMTGLGLEVQIAENGEQAVQLFQDWHPHLIWMDRRMPVMNGIPAARAIRKLPGGGDVKIIAVTASLLRDHHQEMLDAGMDGLVRKPYHFREIYDCLARQLGLQYVYHSAAAAAEEAGAVTLTSSMLAGLPQAVRKDLWAALDSLDSERVWAVIREIGKTDPALGRVLSRYAENFDYPAMLHALASETS